eukprot:4467274-Prymnesium_polylepis.1
MQARSVATRRPAASRMVREHVSHKCTHDGPDDRHVSVSPLEHHSTRPCIINAQDASTLLDGHT